MIATLSLTSKELFHSNMLAWLLENHPSFAMRFLNVDQPVEIKVDREKYNFDLLVTYRTHTQGEDKKVIVENKVKSLPYSKQIQEYKNKEKGQTGFIYLSLMGISDAFWNQHSDVRFIDYKQLSKWISESGKLQNDYHDALVRDYCDLIDYLLEIKEAAEDTQILKFTEDEEKVLRQIRMFDVAQKICYAILAENCTEALIKTGIPNIIFPLEVGFTHSIASFSVKLKFYDDATKSQQAPILLGIQIQGNQYRLFVESETASDDVLPLAGALFENELWLHYEAEATIHKYGKIFKYTYDSGDKIPDLPITDIVNKIKSDVNKLVNNRRQIMELIPKYLQPAS